jgi:multiple sugar transport system ATP-binding protein
MAGLSLQNVTKRFGRHTVIDDVSLDIADGQFAVLVGPSGCGKSTLLRLIAGLEAPNTGEISIGDARANELTPRERGIAMVFQSYALYPHMTVYDNIAFGLTRLSRPKAEIEERVRKAAERLQITHLLARKPGELSGGQRQRVAIGRAIVREPKVFLFDEPLSNLDAALRTQMRLELTDLHRELGTTIVHVTHDQAEAMTLADIIVVLRAGRVEQSGAPLELYDRPVNRFVAEFIGNPSMNMIGAEVVAQDGAGTRVALPGGTSLVVPVDARQAAGQRVTLGVRPEHLREDSDGIAARVAAVEQLGNEGLGHARLPSGELLTWRVTGRCTAQVGAQVRLSLDPAHCHLFDEAGQAGPRLTRGEEGATPLRRTPGRAAF